MIDDEYPSVSLHNVTATTTANWTDDGRQLYRVSESVTADVNITARDRYRHPAGCELRFVPVDSEATVSVTLSAASETVVRPFWGAFQGSEAYELGPVPRTLELSMPDNIDHLESDVAVMGAFGPRVCRLRFDAWAPVAVHDISGPCRPPDETELPSLQYLAYGTSITEGASATGCHLTYVSQVARELNVDALNLGVAGSAFCEPAIAEHVADRDDWDIATLALSINMVNRGFTVEQFRKRVTEFVNTIAAATSGRPIACVTLFPYHVDALRDTDTKRAEDFRAVVRQTVERAPNNVMLIDGPDVADVTGLTTDLLHPGDAGMRSIASGIAAKLATASGSREPRTP
ncbi:SGNH/GDSL hydrolase family protein [Natrialba aegyptia]|uniref:G-D-S-L family lipolytic protein n=1 Tax=Natrialba aegyptia DSM 13077 TaxID=1227491 RepID=M0AKB8_9EURY|nr:SGNH/GDSL hydrolase family protein [Natrialba aegyptia]ELY99135.1 G-D-S-L family lipolytic protein [Natrialba aegyptia DSM 13077]